MQRSTSSSWTDDFRVQVQAKLDQAVAEYVLPHPLPRPLTHPRDLRTDPFDDELEALQQPPVPAKKVLSIKIIQKMRPSYLHTNRTYIHKAYIHKAYIQ